MRYCDDICKEVKITKDVLYATVVDYKGNMINLGYDVYEPAVDSGERRRVIILLHGGGFAYGNDKTQIYVVMMAEHFARKGYVCFSIDYRLRDKVDVDHRAPNPKPVYDTVDDLQLAIGYINSFADTYNIYTDYVLVGGSAGGITVSNFCSASQNGLLTKNRAGVNALILLWGTPYQEFTPIVVDEKFPPTFIVHGTDDKLITYQNAVNLDKILTEHNVKHELMTIQGAGHTPIDHKDEFFDRIKEFLHELQ